MSRKKKTEKKKAAQAKAAADQAKKTRITDDEAAAAGDSQVKPKPEKKAGPVKKVVEAKKVDKPKQKAIIGFGTKGKGTVIHAIADVADSALCDITADSLIANDKLGPKDVTCAKCQKFGAFKSLLDISGESKDESKKKQPKGKKAEPKAKPKPKAQKKKTKKAPETSVPDFQFASREKGKGKNKSFQIYHLPTDKVFFEGIHPKVIDLAIEMLNIFEQRWDKESPLPDNFISNVRKLVKQAYKSCKIKPPGHLLKRIRKQKKKKDSDGDKKRIKIGDEFIVHIYNGKKKEWIPFKEKKKTVITRRKKKEEDKKKSSPSGKISRRTLKGSQIEGKPPFLIKKLMEQGITMGDLTDALVDKFGITKKRAVSKVKGFIRKYVRKRGFLISVMMGTPDPMQDRYKILERGNMVKITRREK